MDYFDVVTVVMLFWGILITCISFSVVGKDLTKFFAFCGRMHGTMGSLYLAGLLHGSAHVAHSIPFLLGAANPALVMRVSSICRFMKNEIMDRYRQYGFEETGDRIERIYISEEKLAEIGRGNMHGQKIVDDGKSLLWFLIGLLGLPSSSPFSLGP